MKKLHGGLLVFLVVSLLCALCGCSADNANTTEDGKKIIRLATMGLDENVQRRVDIYNSQNDEYKIKIDDYSQYSNGDDDNSGETKLTTQILSGDAPDIIDLAQLPYENYISKGLLEDLYPYMDNDPDIDIDDMTESIMGAYAVDGKLYQIIPDYVIVTVIGRSDELGSYPGWSIEEINAYIDGLGADEQSFVYTTKDNILYYCSMLALNQFVSVADNKCDFNNDEFMQLLEFANKYQDEVTLNDDFIPEIELIKDGKVKLNLMSFFDLKTFLYYQEMFGSELVFKGFPTETKSNGSSVDANINLGVSAKSKYKDEVWEFLRTFYLDDYQSSTDYLPISETYLSQRLEEARHFGDNSIVYGWDEFRIKLPNATDNDINLIKGLISSINHPMQKDSKIVQIIVDEAKLYFAGQRSSEETAKIIQSRVKIYINENT